MSGLALSIIKPTKEQIIMSDNELWQAFLYEVTEQLEHLEKELLNAKNNDPETINKLFRYFHSIKSSCAMFEFTAMEEIKIASQNLLNTIIYFFVNVTFITFEKKIFFVGLELRHSFSFSTFMVIK